MAFPEEKKKKPEKKPAGGPVKKAGPPREAPPAGPPEMGGPPMPKPGSPIDPMAAMMGGLGPQPMGPSWMPPMGMGGDMDGDEGGLPLGGQLPPPGVPGGDTMGGSPLLQAMRASVMGGDGLGSLPPGMEHGPMVGQGDPNMGLQQLLAMIAMAKMGVGGQPGAGSSGVDFDSHPSMGMMNGFGG